MAYVTDICSLDYQLNQPTWLHSQLDRQSRDVVLLRASQLHYIAILGDALRIQEIDDSYSVVDVPFADATHGTLRTPMTLVDIADRDDVVAALLAEGTRVQVVEAVSLRRQNIIETIVVNAMRDQYHSLAERVDQLDQYQQNQVNQIAYMLRDFGYSVR